MGIFLVLSLGYCFLFILVFWFVLGFLPAVHGIEADSILLILKQGAKNDKGDKGQEGIKIQVEKQ